MEINANFFFLLHLKVPFISSLSGLDPAGPLFSDGDARGRLDRGDAAFTDMIHTNERTRGIGQNIGHVDFYPHNAGRQPGCPDDGG